MFWKNNKKDVNLLLNKLQREHHALYQKASESDREVAVLRQRLISEEAVFHDTRKRLDEADGENIDLKRQLKHWETVCNIQAMTINAFNTYVEMKK